MDSWETGTWNKEAGYYTGDEKRNRNSDPWTNPDFPIIRSKFGEERRSSTFLLVGFRDPRIIQRHAGFRLRRHKFLELSTFPDIESK